MISIRKVKYSEVVMSVISIILGLMICISSTLSMKNIYLICGVFFIVFGVVKTIGYFTKDFYQLAFQFDFGIGIVSTSIGILLIFKAFNQIELQPILISVIVLIDAIFKFQVAFDSRKFGLERWWIIIVCASLTILFGLGLIYFTTVTPNAIEKLIGLNLCMDGILNLFVILKTVKERERR